MLVNMVVKLGIALSCLAALAACERKDGTRFPDFMTRITSPSPAQSSASLPAAVPAAPNIAPQPLSVPATPSRNQFFMGSEGGNLSPRQPGASAAIQGDNVSLNFVNADIKEVARTVLGDVLQVPFTIDPKLQGNITLQTSGPVPRDDVFAVLENALRISGFALVRTADNYNVVPSNDALRYAPVANGAAPGYSIRIIPVRFVAAEEMRNILSNIVPSDTLLRAVPSKNVLLAAGTQRELNGIVDFVTSFDVNQMRDTSFALLYPKFVDAKTAVRELEAVFDGAQSQGAANAAAGAATNARGLPQAASSNAAIRFTPIERLNAILAVSRSQAYLREAANWLERLDQSSETADERVFVYYVQNGKAADLAGTLNSVFNKSNTTTPRAGAIPLGTIVPPPQDIGALAQPLAAPRITPTAVSPGFDGPDEGIRIGRGSPPQIIADENNNAILILTTPREYSVIQAALTKLDLPPLQVMIEAVVAEVTLTNDLRYGVQWFFRPGAQDFTLSTASSGAVGPTFPGFAAVLHGGSDIRAALNALESVTRVNVLSSPQMMVLNNQTATLQVGDQVPIATQSATSVTTPGAPVVNTIQFRDTGVILRVTPRVNEGGLVQMEISQEVSDVTPTVTSGIDSPTIQQRKFNSSVSVQNAETIALGGLIRERRTAVDSGIPGLKDVPWIGNLFNNTTDLDTRTELVVLITPRVVRSPSEIGRITDEFRERLRRLTLSEQN